MYGGREVLPDDHKFRGQRGRVRARYRRPQLGRGTEKIGETSQRKTNLQLASGAFSCKVAPFTRARRTGSNGQQHPVVIDCEVLQKRCSRCTTPGELRAIPTEPPLASFVRVPDDPLDSVSRQLSPTERAYLGLSNRPCVSQHLGRGLVLQAFLQAELRFAFNALDGLGHLPRPVLLGLTC